MNKIIAPIAALAALATLGGCAVQTQAQINAELSRHIGQSETDLVRTMGVPTRSYESQGHRFLAYWKGESEIDPGFGGGFGGGGFGGPFGYGGYGGYGGFGGGFGYGGYGGWGGWGFGGYGGPQTIRAYGCETDWEVVAGRVVGFTRHGNAC